MIDWCNSLRPKQTFTPCATTVYGADVKFRHRILNLFSGDFFFSVYSIQGIVQGSTDSNCVTGMEKFCYTCGRVISRAKSNATNFATQKYCSHTCRTQKPGTFDRAIEDEFLTRLTRQPVDKKSGVRCDEVEAAIFGQERTEDGQAKARERERVRRAGRRLVVFPVEAPPAQTLPIEEREQVKTGSIREEVLKRGTRFECVQNGKVVEGSFAKGDWGVRTVDWP